MTNSDLRVKLASFEGPLDLLLYLIRQNEIDIREIQIAQITEDYLRTLDLMREYNLDVAGDFIQMAATLILIKSRRLLPQDEEDAEAGDEAEMLTEEALMRRLLEHQRFQEVARHFREMPLLGRDQFKRPLPEDRQKRDQVLKEMSVTELSLALQKVLIRSRRPVRRVQRETVSVAQAAQWIINKLDVSEAVELEELFPAEHGRSEIVATFLAILELGRLRKVRVLQHTVYGTIYVVARETLQWDSLADSFKTGDSYAYAAPEASN